MREALTLLLARGAAGCVVLGEPPFYRRFGFRPESSLVLPDVPPDYFLAVSCGLALPHGVVVAHGILRPGFD